MNYEPIIPVHYVQMFPFYYKNTKNTNIVMLETPPKRWF
jgi:hypothetical protein